MDTRYVRSTAATGAALLLLINLAACGGVSAGSPILEPGQRQALTGLPAGDFSLAEPGAEQIPGLGLDVTRHAEKHVVSVVALESITPEAVLFELNYDPGQYTPLAAQATDAFAPPADSLCLEILDVPGVVSFGQAPVRGSSGNAVNVGDVLAEVLFSAEPSDLSRVAADVPINTGSLCPLAYDAESNTLTLQYVNAGDYDQNGVVSASDLVPLGRHYGTSGPFSFESVLSVVDGNQNGQVEVADLSVIGQNWCHAVESYNFYGSNVPGDIPAGYADPSTIDPLVKIDLTDALGNPVVDRLQIAFEPRADHQFDYYWARPEAEGREGIASNSISTIVNNPPVASLVASPGSGYAPLIVEFNAGASFDSDGEIVEYEWDLDGDGLFERYGSVVNPSFTYDEPGDFEAVVKVTDDNDVSATAAVGIQVLKPPEQAQPWPMAGGGPQHTNRSPYVSAQQGKIKWSCFLEGITSNPSVALDGTVYLTRRDGSWAELVAVDPNGMIKWTFTSYGYHQPALAEDGSIYADGGGTGNIYAVSPVGEALWQVYVGGVRADLTVGPAGNIYVANTSGECFAIEPDGTVKWVYQLGGVCFDAAAVGLDGTSYFGCDDSRVYAINPDGTLKWTYLADAEVDSPAIGPDGTVYVATDDKELLAISPEGEKLWSIVDANWHNPSIGEDGTLYTGLTGDRYAAINPDGSFKWVVEEGSALNQALIDGDGTLFHRVDYQFLARNSDGSIKWLYDNEYLAFGAKAIGADGTLYAYSDGDFLYAFGPSSKNQPPVAGLTADVIIGTARQDVVFDAGASYDPDGEIIYYEWDFYGDDGIYERGGVESTYEYSFRDNGVYTVGLRVTDNSGNHSTAKLTITLSDETVSTAWTSFGGNSRSTRFNPVIGPQTDNVKWTADVRTRSWGSPSVGSDGVVYIGTEEGILFAFNPDGSTKWEYDTGQWNESAPAIAGDGTIYLATSPSEVHAVNPDGTGKWVFTTEGNVFGFQLVSSPVVGPDGTIYVGSMSRDDSLYALNPDGSLKWRFRADAQILTSPAIGTNGTIYFGVSDDVHKFYAVNPDGALQWVFDGIDNFWSSPAVGPDGTVYCTSSGWESALYAINPDGELLWEVHPPQLIGSSPAVSPDGLIYLNGYHNLYVYNPDGTQAWIHHTFSDYSQSPVLSADGNIYLQLGSRVRAVNETGDKVWEAYLDGGFYSSLALGPDGTLFACGDQLLYAFGP